MLARVASSLVDLFGGDNCTLAELWEFLCTIADRSDNQTLAQEQDKLFQVSHLGPEFRDSSEYCLEKTSLDST